MNVVLWSRWISRQTGLDKVPEILTVMGGRGVGGWRGVGRSEYLAAAGQTWPCECSGYSGAWQSRRELLTSALGACLLSNSPVACTTDVPGRSSHTHTVRVVSGRIADSSHTVRTVLHSPHQSRIADSLHTVRTILHCPHKSTIADSSHTVRTNPGSVILHTLSAQYYTVRTNPGSLILHTLSAQYYTVRTNPGSLIHHTLSAQYQDCGSFTHCPYSIRIADSSLTVRTISGSLILHTLSAQYQNC